MLRRRFIKMDRRKGTTSGTPVPPRRDIPTALSSQAPNRNPPSALDLGFVLVQESPSATAGVAVPF